MDNNKYSDVIIEKAVKEFWHNHYPQDVVVFFEQKYHYEENYSFYSELVESHSDHDYENMTFLNDFCEGQTDVIIHEIVPLSDVLDYYSEGNKHKWTSLRE